MDGTGMGNTEQRVPRRVRRIQTISLAMLVVCASKGASAKTTFAE